MNRSSSLLSLAVASILLSACGGGSSNDISDSDDNGGSNGLPDNVSTQQINASSSDTAVYMNLETGSVLTMTDEEGAASSDWHLAFKRNNIQLNSGASGPGQVAGAVAADQADFYTGSGEPNSSVFLNATADSELEHLLAPMSEPSSWTSDAVVSQFGSDWYVHNLQTGQIAANPDNGWLVRSAEGDSYARMQVNGIDFPTRTMPPEGVKSFQIDFDVQPAAQATFTGTATFTGSIPGTGGEVCFDFDSDATVGCDTATWDVKLGFVGRDFYLRTNSGPSGDGDGGAFGPFEWTELETYTNATLSDGGQDITHHYEADSSGGIFTNSLWYAYSLQGNHKLWPNYRVYLIDTDSTDDASPIYAMQVTGYYNDSGESGHPAIRWTPVELTTAN